jgi:D-sedoheptulose 7-phosphate isomerase
MPQPMVESLTEHLRVVQQALEQVAILERAAERIVNCFRSGGRLYVLGNGGSAADAQHIAAELVGRFKHDRTALPAVALTTDTSILTAVTNDLGGDEVFLRQVKALVTGGDILWALSVSGSSPNVIKAAREARRIGAFVIGFTGTHGHQLKKLSDLSFVADSERSDRVQEAHQLAYHLVCERVEEAFLEER